MREVDVYPLTIIRSRYGGAYSGGKYLAFKLYPEEIPGFVHSDDVSCMSGWDDYKGKVGKGNTVQSAYVDLCEKISEEQQS